MLSTGPPPLVLSSLRSYSVVRIARVAVRAVQVEQHIRLTLDC